MPLTDKQKAFAKHYCLTFNKTEAARLAGCPESGAYQTGWRWFRDPEIKEFIQKTIGKAAEKVDLQLEDLLADTQEIKERCLNHPTDFNPGAALKAIELQGKFLKLLSDKVETEHKGEITVTIKRIGANEKKPKP